MRIMSGGSAKATIVPLTRQNKVDGLVTRQSSGVVEEMEGRQTPVYAIES